MTRTDLSWADHVLFLLTYSTKAPLVRCLHAAGGRQWGGQPLPWASSLPFLSSLGRRRAVVALMNFSANGERGGMVLFNDRASLLNPFECFCLIMSMVNGWLKLMVCKHCYAKILSQVCVGVQPWQIACNALFETLCFFLCFVCWMPQITPGVCTALLRALWAFPCCHFKSTVLIQCHVFQSLFCD